MPVLVAAPITETKDTPACPTKTFTLEGAAAPAEQFVVESVMAMCAWAIDRKSTRLNSSHGYISYAVFCLKKKNCLRPCSQGKNDKQQAPSKDDGFVLRGSVEGTHQQSAAESKVQAVEEDNALDGWQGRFS